VYLFVSKKTLESSGWIFENFGELVKIVPEKGRLNFGSDSGRILDVVDIVCLPVGQQYIMI